MHALLVSEYGALNGGEFSFLAALPKLQSAGFEFTAALPPDTDFARLLADNNVRIEPFSFHDDANFDSDDRGSKPQARVRSRKPQSQIRAELEQLISRLNVDLVHANSLAAGRILGPVTANLKAVGLGYIRDIIKLSKKAIEDVSQLDRIVAVSQATANLHIANGMPAEKILVIHNGVDLQRFRPKWLDLKPTPFLDTRVCLCIGQIGMRKGIDLTLKMLAQAFSQIPNAELWIVGERHSQKQEAVEYEQQLHSFVKENFADGAVKWLGRRDDVPDLMRQADVLVHAARQEPLGRVLLEAAASGLPIVTTSVGGTPEILSGLEDFMFDPKNFDAAIPAVTELLLNEERHREVSTALRKVAEQKFSAERAGEDLKRCYQTAIKR